MHHRDSADDRTANSANEPSQPADEQSHAARGAIGAGAIAVGASASIDSNAATADDPSATGTTETDSSEESTADAGSRSEPAMDTDSRADADPNPDPLVLVSIHDYQSGIGVRVVDRLPAPITVQLLRLPNGDTVPVLTRPDEYTGYVVRFECGSRQVYSTMTLFTREALEVGACYAFGTDVQVFSDRLHLFRVTAHRVGGHDDG